MGIMPALPASNEKARPPTRDQHAPPLFLLSEQKGYGKSRKDDGDPSRMAVSGKSGFLECSLVTPPSRANRAPYRRLVPAQVWPTAAVCYYASTGEMPCAINRGAIMAIGISLNRPVSRCGREHPGLQVSAPTPGRGPFPEWSGDGFDATI